MECVLFLHAERMFVIKYIFSRKVAKSRRETEGFSSMRLTKIFCNEEVYFNFATLRLCVKQIRRRIKRQIVFHSAIGLTYCFSINFITNHYTQLLNIIHYS